MIGQAGYDYQRLVHLADSAQRNGFQCCKISLALIRSHGFSPMVSAALMYEKLLPTRFGQFRNGSRPLSKFGGCRIHDVHLRRSCCSWFQTTETPNPNIWIENNEVWMRTAGGPRQLDKRQHPEAATFAFTGRQTFDLRG